MMFTNPIWLWGFAGLIVPVAIHLLSRKESRIIKLGSIRHLQNAITKQSVSFKLNELLLLSIRCALITIIVFLLSGLSLTSQENRGQDWLLIESGLDGDRQFKPLEDSLTDAGFKIKKFAPGFPDASETNAIQATDYWGLVQDLEQEGLNKAIVMSWNKANGFKGQRISKPNKLIWITKEPDSVEFPLTAVMIHKDSIMLRSGASGLFSTSFQNAKRAVNVNDSLSISEPDSVTIQIVADPAFTRDKRILIAAINALQENLLVKILLTDGSSENAIQKTDWLVWVSKKPLPKNIESNILLLDSNALVDNMPLFVKHECSQGFSCWSITRRLTTEVALKYRLTLTLFTIFMEDIKQNYAVTLASNDVRIQSDLVNWSTASKSEQAVDIKSSKAELSVPLAIALIVFLLIERLIAIKRSQ